ncbi:hypothetical protein JHK82_055776 [Glycine max]|nr:hypothetical protein JHK85_056601 [Glycine max]KAG5074406.1 hypothetical protein JHK84_055637 [Glycine max]KAG5077081.1 hypothetical protein JHK82_055776 [Glycine max]
MVKELEQKILSPVEASFSPLFPSQEGQLQSSLRMKCVAIGNGLFTQTTPEVHRIVLENDHNLRTVKIVYEDLQAQYQSSLIAAVITLNSKRKHASYEVLGYLVEELWDVVTYKTFCKDLEDANIFIGSLIFVEELALKIKATVEKERERLDAVLVFPSMAEVMRLNKLGSFSMSQLR